MSLEKEVSEDDEGEPPDKIKAKPIIEEMYPYFVYTPPYTAETYTLG